MPGGGIHLRSVRALEQELQCELNQPRVVGLRSDRSKPVIVGVELPGVDGVLSRCSLCQGIRTERD